MKTNGCFVIILILLVTTASSCATTSTPSSASAPTLSSIETAPLPQTQTPSPTYTPASTLTFTATSISCTASTQSEYVISGSADSDEGIFVDDILRVFVNEVLLAEISQGGRCCQPAAPIRFVANTGDTLRIQAQDANNCYGLETLWLQKSDGSCLTLLTNGASGPNCGSEIPKQVFFNQTFVLP